MIDEDIDIDIDEDTLPTRQEFKDEARQLRKDNPEITSHGAALHLLSKKYGYNNWNYLSTILKDDHQS